MFDYENKYKNLGLIAGIDEAGRGPLAGPVVCACVVMPLESDKIIEGINDSKKLSPQKREFLFEKIVNTALDFCIVPIEHTIIDRINILNATKTGMKKCLEGLKNPPYVVLVDAVRVDTQVKQENIIKGDCLSYNIACASILAKVSRDRLMVRYSKEYPDYCFEKHKGYATKEHIFALKEFGKCPIHRDSFLKNFL